VGLCAWQQQRAVLTFRMLHEAKTSAKTVINGYARASTHTPPVHLGHVAEGDDTMICEICVHGAEIHTPSLLAHGAQHNFAFEQLCGQVIATRNQQLHDPPGKRRLHRSFGRQDIP